MFDLNLPTTKTKATFLFVLLNLLKTSFGSLCFFYPNYPSFDPVVAIHCFESCCAGYITNASRVCCTSSSKSTTNTSSSTSYWWIIFPVVGCLLIVTVFVINRIFLRIKLKNRIRNSNRSMFGTDQGSSIPSGVYHISSASGNYYGRAGYESSRPFDIQNRLPTYNELFKGQTANSNVFLFQKPSSTPTAIPESDPVPKIAETTLSTVETTDADPRY